MTTARSGVPIKIGSDTYTLRLTLGAMADMEDHFGVTNFNQLMKKMQADASSKTTMAMLEIMARAGGKSIPKDALRDADLGSVFPAMEKIFEAIEGETGGAPGKPAAADTPPAKS